MDSRYEHALQRYQEHYLTASLAEMMADMHMGVELSGELTDYLTGRKWKRRSFTPQRYVLSTERKGIFVVVAEQIVTYLRLGHLQYQFAVEHWPQTRRLPVIQDLIEPPPPRKELYEYRHPTLKTEMGEVRITADLMELFGGSVRARWQIWQAIMLPRPAPSRATHWALLESRTVLYCLAFYECLNPKRDLEWWVGLLGRPLPTVCNLSQDVLYVAV